MVVDEDLNFSVGSDHNALLLKIKINQEVIPNSKSANEDQIVSKWNITERTNWSEYSQNVEMAFMDWNPKSFYNVDEMWQSFKSRPVISR